MPCRAVAVAVRTERFPLPTALSARARAPALGRRCPVTCLGEWQTALSLPHQCGACACAHSSPATRHAVVLRSTARLPLGGRPAVVLSQTVGHRRLAMRPGAPPHHLPPFCHFPRPGARANAGEVCGGDLGPPSARGQAADQLACEPGWLASTADVVGAKLAAAGAPGIGAASPPRGGSAPLTLCLGRSSMHMMPAAAPQRPRLESPRSEGVSWELPG